MTKTGANRGAALERPAAWDPLKAVCIKFLPDEQAPLVTRAALRRVWHQTLKESGFESTGPPCGLRRAAAARFVDLGGDLETARRRGSLASPSSLHRYTTTRVGGAARAAEGANIKKGERFWGRHARRRSTTRSAGDLAELRRRGENF